MSSGHNWIARTSGSRPETSPPHHTMSGDGCQVFLGHLFFYFFGRSA